jgi:tetratricopeptide (TPR) repeat protein
MARRKKQSQQEETIVNIVDARDNVHDFFEKNQNLIYIIVGGLAIIVGGYLAYTNLYQKPRQAEAVEQMFQAEFMFQRDSFALALENPGGGYGGFTSIIEDYGGTKAANTAKYYAGICYLNLGRYDDAITYLEKFKPAGDITPIMKYGTLGDCYSELQNFDKALSMYQKAGTTKENEFLTPYYLKKLALLHDHQGNGAESLKIFKKLKAEYPNSLQASDVDKYIAKFEVQ